MCGIAGIKRFGDKQIEEIQIRLFLTGLESRGNDATGIAMQRRNGEVLVCKSDVPAWQFVSQQLYKDFIKDHLSDDITQVILHTRGASQGNPRVNKNNHPLTAGKAALIHNGMLSNDDFLFKDLKLDRAADTDSDILRAIVDEFGFTKEAIRKLNRVNGGAAIAALHPDYPGKMLLGRSGNPIVLGSTPEFLVFASEKEAIHRSMRPWVERFGHWFQVMTPDLAFSPFPNDTCWIIGERGVEWHDSMKMHIGNYKEPFRSTYSQYSERQRKFDLDAKPKKYGSNKGVIQIDCPTCKKHLTISPEQRHLSLEELFCPKEHGGCGNTLAPKKSLIVC